MTNCGPEGCVARLAGETPPSLTRDDFRSSQEVKWCPGCGDYGILAQVQKVLPRLGIPRERIVFVSGIGCSSRFPYYLNTYGMHSIHGRAPAIAMGLKCARPELSVWVVTGDGDGLSIGTNHLIHCMRRNLDVNILLFNNQIYGLTKGQYSPTSEFGKKTKSSPLGTIEQPIHPIEIALAAEATFVARTVIADQAHLGETIEAAARHRGTSFVEILQNCVVFNENVLENFGDRSLRDENWVRLEHGQADSFRSRTAARASCCAGWNRPWPWSAKTGCGRKTCSCTTPDPPPARRRISWPRSGRPIFPRLTASFARWRSRLMTAC